MSLFGRSAGQPGTSKERLEQIKVEVSNQLALANAQELVNTLTNKCYKACVTKPSTSLSSSEERCLERCQDRFLESFAITSRSYMNRIASERRAAAALAPGLDASPEL